MNNPNATISDIYICEAFKQILMKPRAEFKQTIDKPTYQDIIIYLAQFPQVNRNERATMANYIADFCLQPGNEKLNKWLKEIYNSLHKDGINQLVKKTNDPGEESTDESETERLIMQKSRDICQELQRLVESEKTQINPKNQNESNAN